MYYWCVLTRCMHYWCVLRKVHALLICSWWGVCTTYVFLVRCMHYWCVFSEVHTKLTCSYWGACTNDVFLVISIVKTSAIGKNHLEFLTIFLYSSGIGASMCSSMELFPLLPSSVKPQLQPQLPAAAKLAELCTYICTYKHNIIYCSTEIYFWNKKISSLILVFPIYL